MFLAERGIGAFQIGVLQTVLFLTTFLSEVPTGVFGDRHGRRKSVMLGLALMALSGAGYLVFRTFNAFVSLRVLEGLGMAFVSGSDQSLLYDMSNYVHERIPSNIRAATISLRSMIESGIVCAFYLAFGKVLDAVVPPHAMALLALVPMVCFGALCMGRRTLRFNAR